MNWKIRYGVIPVENGKIKFGIANFTKRELTVNTLTEPVRRGIASVHEALHVYFGPNPSDLGHYKLHIMSIIFHDAIMNEPKYRRIKYPVQIISGTDGFYHITRGNTIHDVNGLINTIIQTKLSNAKISLTDRQISDIIENTKAIVKAKDGDVLDLHYYI